MEMSKTMELRKDILKKLGVDGLGNEIAWFWKLERDTSLLKAPKTLIKRMRDWLSENIVPEFMTDGLEIFSSSELTDEQVISLCARYLGSVTVTESDGKLILKYFKGIYAMGWSKFSMGCRGLVLDAETYEVISHPYDKFFNLNENALWTEAIILEKLNHAKTIEVTEKMDGSLIAATNTGKELLITTNGSFNNVQIDEARAIIGDRKLPEGKTFIFELISPEDLHVLNYNGERNLYLHGIRNLADDTFAKRAELEATAKALNFKIVAIYDETNLDEYIELSKNNETNKEGWVFVVYGKDGDRFSFKLKREQFLKLQTKTHGINERKAYYITGEELALLHEHIAEAYLAAKEEIEINKTKLFNLCYEYAEEYKNLSGKELYDAVSTAHPQLCPQILRVCKGLNPYTARLTYDKYVELKTAYFND